jgi:hypothetical protein
MIFDLRSFDLQIRCSVFRLSVPFGLRSFGLRSFGLGSLFGLGSNSTFCLSTFCHSTFCLSAFGHSTFCHSTYCLSTLCRWIDPWPQTRRWPLPRTSHFTILWLSIKGTHARDFHSLFLNFFLHLSVTNRYKTQYRQHFRKYSSNSPRYSKFSITRRFRRKREAWLSVVAENAESNLALSS